MEQKMKRKNLTTTIISIALLCLDLIVCCFGATLDNLVVLDPTIQNSIRWDNACTETVFGDGKPPFTTVVYSGPQVAWNGTHWVSYEIMSMNETAVFLRTPTCTYIIEKLYILLFDPNFTRLHVGRMEWVVQQYEEEQHKWHLTTPKDTSVGYNSTHVWQKWTLSDGGQRVFYIGCDNKQTVIFTPTKCATYRLAWRFQNISASRVTYLNGTHIDLNEGYERIHRDFYLSKLAFLDDDRFSLLVGWTGVENLYCKELILRCSGLGRAHLDLYYGDWTLSSNEPLIIDPETQTFPGEAALDGSILKFDPFYPPEYSSVWGGEVWAGQDKDTSDYWIFRGYLSFDTSSIRDYAVIINATLKIKTKEDHSLVDFTTRIMGGAQPIYGSSLEATDWGCGTTEAASWPSSQYPGNNMYVNISIPKEHINTKGRTQFELKSNREGTPPSSVELDEYLIFYTAEWSGKEPKLEVVWLPHQEYTNGVYWYYWNHTSSQKVAIMLFGGGAIANPPCVLINSIFRQDENGLKEKVISDLYQNGIDIISPKQESGYDNRIYYYKTSTWIYDAAMWLLGKGYTYIFLFGFSAGGVATAYEIQKDYASVFSAVVIASAPVDAQDPFTDALFRSARTASKVKTCTSFVVGVNDSTDLGQGYPQMSIYFNNTDAHKDWHKWNNGHDIFPYTCLTHPGESVSQAVDGWFTPHSCSLRNPSFEGRLRSVYGCADWQSSSLGCREVRGDVDADGDCDIVDISSIGKVDGSVVGDAKYDWRLDLNGDGKIDQNDLNLANEDYGKSAERLDGSYSWYTSAGGECQMWQWLNHSVNLLKGKQITFEYWFKPKTLPSGAYAQSRIYYIDNAGEKTVSGNNVYYTEIKWYKATVTASLPTSTTTIKIIIFGKPDFKVATDSSKLTTSP